MSRSQTLFASVCFQVTTTETEEEELPVWARREVVRQLERQDGVDLPFGVYLLASALVAIAAVSTPRRVEDCWLACEHCCPVPNSFGREANSDSLPESSVTGAADDRLPCRWALSLSSQTKMQSLAPCRPAVHYMHPFCSLLP